MCNNNFQFKGDRLQFDLNFCYTNDEQHFKLYDDCGRGDLEQTVATYGNPYKNGQYDGCYGTGRDINAIFYRYCAVFLYVFGAKQGQF